jgi:segregation and condensation protein B
MLETVEQKKELEVPTSLAALFEALIFAAREPLSIHQIKAVYSAGNRNDPTRQIDADSIRAIIEELNKGYKEHEKAYRILKIAGGYQFATTEAYADWIGKLYKEQGRRKLSQSGIETLSIVAYKQPVTKAEIEHIRGVNCDYVLKALLEKELVTVTGRAETVGRPLLYGTTREFLKYFGLNEITDLPRPREIEEILGEPQFETERRMLEAQAGAVQMKKEQEDFKSRLPHIPKRRTELEEKTAEIVARTNIKQIRTVQKPKKENEQANLQPEIEFAQVQDDATKTEFEEQVPVAAIASEPPVETLPPEEPQQMDKEMRAESADQPFDLLAPNDKSQTLTRAWATTREISEKSTWQNWKEKIQGFIKKLFV